MFIYIFLLLILFLIYPIARIKTEPLNDLKMKYKKYSGLEPEIYLEFVNNLELVPKDPVFLDRAVDALRRLSAYAPDPDEFDLDDEILKR